MINYSVRLFGKFHMQCNGKVLKDIPAYKAQELFYYLLLHRGREHPREVLANLMWSDSSTTQAKAYLRKALWQLQLALDTQAGPSDSTLLLVDSGWVQINEKANLWLDVAVFEQAFAPVQGIPGEKLDDRDAQALQRAVALYRTDLLEDCYQSWCLYERQRLRHMYVTMLDKLACYCEAHQEYEAGLEYGSRILQYDRAHEATHRRLMRLHYFSGDRTRALRQFESCVAALNEELDVCPTEYTRDLYEQIKTNQPVDVISGPVALKDSALLSNALRDLKHLHALFEGMQSQVEQNMQVIEQILKRFFN